MNPRNVLVTVIACGLLMAVDTTAAPEAKPKDAGRLDFLYSQDASRAYALDSSLAFEDFGLVLDPPYERGLDQLTVLGGLHGDLFVADVVDLSGGGRLTAFALSPDGDTAVVGRMLTWRTHEVAIVRGLSGEAPYVSKVLPFVSYDPHAIAVAPDGSYAVIGSEERGAPCLVVISGLPANPRISGRIQLRLRSGYGGKPESVKFSLDGERVLVQTALWDFPDPPLRFLPRIVLQVVFGPKPGGEQVVSEPFLLPQTPAIPPQPPYEDLDTGIALGDSALLRDGDSVIVPVCGAVELGQFDARILLLSGARTGDFEVVRTLGPEDGVVLAPFQVVLAPDCDRAFVTSGNSFLEISGLSDASFANVTVSAMGAAYEFPSEPAITPDGAVLVISHPRVPVDDVPPGAAVTNYDTSSLQPIGEPFFGPVRSLVYFKEGCLRGHPSGLIDYVDLFTDDLADEVGDSLRADVLLAIRLADRGRDDAALAELDEFRRAVEALRQAGSLTDVEAGVLDDLAALASGRLR